MKLTDNERKVHVVPLLENGWSMVNGRDAIQKEFSFKDFNEVQQHFSFINFE